jgi:hypothetical protein
MKKFLAVYMAPVLSVADMMKGATDEQKKAGMDAWMNWMNAHKDVFADMGAPLGKTKRVMPSGVTDVKNEFTGYSVVQAESLDAAAALFTPDLPHFQLQGAWVEVMEIMEVPTA